MRLRTTPEEYKSLFVDSEADIQRRILVACCDLGIVAWRTNSGRKGRVLLAPAGTPDIIGYLPGGRMLGIEVKRPGETMHTSQIEWHARASAAGVACVCVDNLRDAIVWLQKELRR